MSSRQQRTELPRHAAHSGSDSSSAAVRHLHPRSTTQSVQRSAPHDAVGIAVQRLQAGEMVIVIDDPDRENEGDLVMAAQFATPANMAFMVRHTTGIICAPMTDARADQLGLPLMVTTNTDPHGTAFTVSVDAVGTGTGVSAGARAATVAALAASTTSADDLRVPGHIFPLRARAGGVLERGGHTEAAVDLLRLAEVDEVAVIGELVADDGDMMRGQELMRFAAQHDLPVVSIAELVAHRQQVEPTVQLCGQADLPTAYGVFAAQSYRDDATGLEHLVLVGGDHNELMDRPEGVLTRVHSECLTGDLAASLRCDCGDQLRESLQQISRDGGILIYLRGHEGRGIGLGDKLRAYTLQQAGRDTVDANLELGLPVDSRDYAAAAQILHQLGVTRIRLISNNPVKSEKLAGYGIEVVDCLHLPTRATTHNINYLRTKKDRLGHVIDLVPSEEAPCG